MIRKLLKYTGTFLCGLFLLTLLLVAVAKIPQSAIQSNMEESAKFLCESEQFGTVIENVESSKIDRYADSILLGIAYQYDSEKPLESVMRSSFYTEIWQNENENLRDAVNLGKEANQQYLRYWHGSIAIVRPLLTIFNISQIYVVNGIVCGILAVLLIVILVKNKASRAAIAVALGLVGTSAWFVPLSLEYTWTYLLMLAAAIVAVLLYTRNKEKQLGLFFMVVGMLTSYLDFLTTETLTLTVPLLLILWFLYREKNRKSEGAVWKQLIRWVLLWSVGYAGMWISKWLIASVVLSENVMPYVVEHMSERIGGDLGISMGAYMFGAVFNNVKSLFPFEYGIVGIFAGILLLVFLLYRGYVYYQKKPDRRAIGVCLFIGLIPYVRYLVLHNHSYLHCFFTYRAQMGTIIAFVFILEIVTDGRWLPHGRNKQGSA